MRRLVNTRRVVKYKISQNFPIKKELNYTHRSNRQDRRVKLARDESPII